MPDIGIFFVRLILAAASACFGALIFLIPFAAVYGNDGPPWTLVPVIIAASVGAVIGWMALEW